jgi:hypothetical protein
MLIWHNVCNLLITHRAEAPIQPYPGDDKNKQAQKNFHNE